MKQFLLCVLAHSSATAGGLLVIVGSLNAVPVRAQTTPPVTPTPIVDFGLQRDEVLGLIGANAKITWHTNPTVDHFELTASLLAVRVNRADPFCSPPSTSDTRTISIAETLHGATTEFHPQFPPLSQGDAWFVASSDVRLRAFAADGHELGGEGGGGISESTCPRPVASPTTEPPRQLPRTGIRDQQARVDTAFALTAIGAAFLMGGVVLAMRDTRQID